MRHLYAKYHCESQGDAKLITLETAEKQLFFRGFLTKLGEQ